MKLHFKKIGYGEPLMIIHGLFGSSDNWGMLGKKFAEKFTVYLHCKCSKLERHRGNVPWDLPSALASAEKKRAA